MVKNVEIPVHDYAVAGDWYQGSNEATAVLFLHGYPSVKAHQIEFAAHIVETTGLSVLTFDYSGLGESPFTTEETTTAQHYDEAKSCYDWLKSNGYSNIVPIGTSYGGYLAAHLWQDRGIKYMVLRAPAINPADTFDTLQPLIPYEQKQKLRTDSVALAKHPLIVKCREYAGKSLIVVHGKDELVPKQTTDAYIQALRADKYEQKEFYHALSNPDNPQDKFDEYNNAITDWLKTKVIINSIYTTSH